MAEIVSHGTWSQGPAAETADGFRYQTFARADGTDWYDHVRVALSDPATTKVMVRDGRALMVDRDGSRIVPPGEVLEVPDGIAVERNWLWRDGAFVPPEPEIVDPVGKLRAFLADNPDVRSILG